MLAQVDMPALKLHNLEWLISEVTFIKGFGSGTRTMVTLMPPEAFQPQPSLDTPYDPEISSAMAKVLQERQTGGRLGHV